MTTITDHAELQAACKARNFDPVNLSGLAYILKVCEIRKFKYKNSHTTRYELLYHGKKAYGAGTITNVNNKRKD